MMGKYVLISPRVVQNCIREIMEAGHGYVVSISEPKRSADQNSKFHAICGDLAKSGMRWAGKERNLNDWKALLVSAHSVATETGGEVIPGLEGEFVAIRESTSRMTVSRASSLLEYTIAFCVSNGIELSDAKDGGWVE